MYNCAGNNLVWLTNNSTQNANTTVWAGYYITDIGSNGNLITYNTHNRASGKWVN